MTPRRLGRRVAATAAAATLLALAPTASASAGRDVSVVLTLRPGTSAADVARYLARHGFTVTSRGRTTLAARGPATTAATLSQGLRAEVAYVAGLEPQRHWRHAAVPAGFTGSSLASAYDVVAGDGTGLTIATVQFSGWRPSDLATYATAAGLANPNPTQVTVGSGNPADTADGGDFEVALDQEVLLAAAPKAAQRVYFGRNDLTDAILVYSRIADDAEAGLVDVVSTSWGMCEPDADTAPTARASIETQLRRIVAAGATVFAASGDYGAYDCADPGDPNAANGTVAVDYPASSASVVAVGGTRLTGAAGAWAETAWNQPLGGTFKGYASGGGESSSVARPAWQAGLTLPGTHRLVPDIAAVADPSTGFGAYAASAGGWVLGGGTSAAAPLAAGHLAAVLSANGRTTGVGDLHDELYANPTAFRDVTSGTNLLYGAGTGYDRATGLGSPRWSALSAALFGSPVVTAPAATKSLTVPLHVTPPQGMTVISWTVGEGGTVTCDPVASAAVPTEFVLAAGDRATRVAVGALDANGCHVGTAPVTLDTRAPAATGTVKSVTGTSARTSFAWGAVDPAPSSGLRTFDVCVYAIGYGCSWTSTGTTARTATLILAQGRTYVLRVTAVDAAGNRSALYQSPRYVVPVDERSLSRSGGWRAGYSKSDWYGSHTGSATKGAWMSRTLSGTRYELFYVAQPSGGVMDVYIGGRLVKRISTYATSKQYRRVVTLATYSTRASRSVRIVVRGTRDSRSSGYAVSVDALRVAF
jgi:hypothetical protein